MAYGFKKLHLQDKMEFARFSTWTAFKVEKRYYEQWGHYSSGSGCSAVAGTTVVTQVDEKDLTKSINTYDQFTFEPYQESLFYTLIQRAGFKLVSSDTSFSTHVYNADDNGGYIRDEYKTPKSDVRFYKKERKNDKNFFYDD
ncbi:unnamed protein product [Adineta ricciae]|uniref:Uncharacterized protein n=1 Tax=Adineta ricciae TaxID=249248 RepID=A0A815USE0_ADIRI|nr:unnamed protein product [Adineta ricciae]